MDPRRTNAPHADALEEYLLNLTRRRFFGHMAGTIGAGLGTPLGDLPPLRAKGLAGTLIERALGASAGSTAEPDFPALGIELKTIPIDAAGRICESTFVCTIALGRIADGTYGYCEETGEPISLKRLDARPIATMSLEAQEKKERMERVFRED